MKALLMCICLFVLRCCWGPTEYQVMQVLQNDANILKTLYGTYKINTLKLEEVSVHNITISFNDSMKQVSGFSGCNRFFGSYRLEENSLTFNQLASTKMLCSENKNKTERKFLKTLEKANTIYFSENGFSLFNNKTLLLSASKVIEENHLSFEYSASSRGNYKHIKIDKTHIKLSKKRAGKSLKRSIDSKHWETLVKLSEAIEIKSINNLKAPSKKFQFDGAPLAHLKITLNGQTYTSAPFDHKNPPEDIAELVKEILSIAENIE
ncbi:META domain-containing protein [Jejuia pallidilutea]|nr:META domain-containing protein [Jejuia pallidilutea]